MEEVFRGAGLPAPYLLYRTCQHRFKEGPHNLLPSQRQPERRKGWTVYLQFKDSRLDLDNLARIIAFPDGHESSLPMLKHVRLGDKKKADIWNMPTGTEFGNLDEFREYLSRLPVEPAGG